MEKVALENDLKFGKEVSRQTVGSAQTFLDYIQLN